MLFVANRVRYKINGQLGSQHFFINNFLGDVWRLRWLHEKSETEIKDKELRVSDYPYLVIVRPVFTELGNGGGIDPTDCRFDVSSSQDTKESVYDDDIKVAAFQTKVARDGRRESLPLFFVNEM
jgi:hypothetical protein